MDQRLSGSFNPRDAFFVLDSDSLEQAGTRLYGYTFAGDEIVDTAEGLNGQEPGGEGAYILINRQGNRLTITQDYVGCWGLYLFRDGNYFALSNSFLMLAEHVRKAHTVTLNREYADFILFADLASSVYGETLVNEISVLDRRAAAEIDIPSKTLDIHYADYGEKAVELDSAEAAEIMDAWRNKWTGRIRKICAGTHNIQLDLSGGFDTRGMLSLFLSSGADLGGVMVYSNTDGLHCHTEDYAVAGMLAEQYGFELNKSFLLSSGMDPFSVEDILNLSFYAKLGFHKEMYFKAGRMKERRYNFSGNGGECIRCRTEKWKYSEEEYLDSAVKRFSHLADRNPALFRRMENSARTILPRSFRALQDFHDEYCSSLAGQEWSWREIYRETRCRYHYGKAILEGFLANIIIISPMLDPDLSRLKLSTEDCPDENLLFARILDRYTPGLLEVPFEGGRSIQAETAAYARELNRKYPFSPDSGAVPVQRENMAAENGAADGPGPAASIEEADEVLRKAVLSSAFRKQFEDIFDESAYNSVLWFMANKKFFPLSVAYAAIGIVWMRRITDLSGTPETTCSRYMAELAEEYDREQQALREPVPAGGRFAMIPEPVKKILRPVKEKLAGLMKKG